MHNRKPSAQCIKVIFHVAYIKDMANKKKNPDFLNYNKITFWHDFVQRLNLCIHLAIIFTFSSSDRRFNTKFKHR